MTENLPIRCSPAIVRALLLNDVPGDAERGFWLSFAVSHGAVSLFWPLIPGAEDMVGKVVEK